MEASTAPATPEALRSLTLLGRFVCRRRNGRRLPKQRLGGSAIQASAYRRNPGVPQGYCAKASTIVSASTGATTTMVATIIIHYYHCCSASASTGATTCMATITDITVITVISIVTAIAIITIFMTATTNQMAYIVSN